MYIGLEPGDELFKLSFTSDISDVRFEIYSILFKRPMFKRLIFEQINKNYQELRGVFCLYTWELDQGDDTYLEMIIRGFFDPALDGSTAQRPNGPTAQRPNGSTDLRIDPSPSRSRVRIRATYRSFYVDFVTDSK